MEWTDWYINIWYIKQADHIKININLKYIKVKKCIIRNKSIYSAPDECGGTNMPPTIQNKFVAQCNLQV